MADRQILGFVRSYMDEVETTLAPIAGVDYGEYKQSLVRRFANPAVADQVSRLAQDGSTKIPISILEPLADRLATGKPVPMLSLALAGWMVYASEAGEGRQAPLSDPLASQIVANAEGAGDDPARFLDEARVFPPEVASSPVLRAAFREHVRGLAAGARRYLRRLLPD